MTFLVSRVKIVKDLIIDKLDHILPKLDLLIPKLDTVLSRTETLEQQTQATIENDSSLLKATIHLVETVQHSERDRVQWQQQTLNQLNALYRQGISQKESQQQISEQLEGMQQQITQLQIRIQQLERSLAAQQESKPDE